MLLRMLNLLARKGAPQPPHGHRESPHEQRMRVHQAHKAAPIERHMRIAYAGMKVGEQDIAAFSRDCLREAGTSVMAAKAMSRPLRFYFLAQYYLYALGIAGLRAECGVLRGASAVAACRAARTRIPEYAGEGLHLIDSFEGLSEPSPQDRFEGWKDGDERMYGKGTYKAPLDAARASLAAFSAVTFHKGWVPEVFGELPEAPWAFVHLDMDLYEPTYAGLAYFYPKLSPGGVILCDDYGSPTFPGAHRAWNAFCEERGVPFAVLDTGQSVILKDA